MRGIITTAVACALGIGMLAPWQSALAGHGESRVARYINELRCDRDDDDREDAAEHLGRLGDPRAVPALVQALLSDPDDDVREEAAEALGRIGDARALPALRHAAATDDDKSVRKEAREAIERIAPPRPVIIQRPPVTVIEHRPVVRVTPQVSVRYRSAPRYRRPAPRPAPRYRPVVVRPQRHARTGGVVTYQSKHLSIAVRW